MNKAEKWCVLDWFSVTLIECVWITASSDNVQYDSFCDNIFLNLMLFYYSFLAILKSYKHFLFSLG